MPVKTGASRGRSDADVLNGIGRGILADLDASIRESVDEQAASARAPHGNGTAAEEEPPRSARNPDESLRETFGPDREKRVMFDSHISNPSAQDTHSKERSSSEEENKLDGLNRMLKEGGLSKLMNIENDSGDFELFVSKLKGRDMSAIAARVTEVPVESPEEEPAKKSADDSAEASGPDMSKYAVNEALLEVISNRNEQILSAREREKAENEDLAEMSLQKKVKPPKKSKYGDLADIDDIL